MIAKVKNYNLNVTEVRHPDFKNIFPGIFNFTVGILLSVDLLISESLLLTWYQSNWLLLRNIVLLNFLLILGSLHEEM